MSAMGIQRYLIAEENNGNTSAIGKIIVYAK